MRCTGHTQVSGRHTPSANRYCYSLRTPRHFGNRFGDFYLGLACGFFRVSHGQGHSDSHALLIVCWRDPAVFVRVTAAWADEVGLKKRR
jgi:hypothetical protein